MNNRTSMRDNMQDKQITIESIYKGQANSYISGGDYLSSIAIDPDANVSTAIQKISGTVTPIAHETIEAIDGNPMWILPNSKNDEHLIYTDTGKVYFLDSSLAIIGSPITLTNASGNGAVYYNNYYYLIKDNDLDRIKVTDKTHEVDLLENKETRTYYATSSNTTETLAGSLNFGDGQDYQKITQQFESGFFSSGQQFNKLKLKMQSSSGTHNIDIEFRAGGTSTNPDTATVIQTQTVSVTTTEEIFDITFDPIVTTLSSSFNHWIVIKPSGTFSAGEYIKVLTNNSASISNANTRGFDGTDWVIPASSDKKNLAMQLYFEGFDNPKLRNETYPTNGITKIPNHASYVAGNDNLYISDVTSAKIGTLHKLKSFGILKVNNTNGNTISTDSILFGNTSKAEATILGFKEYPFSFETTNNIAELIVFNPKGSFEIGESVKIGGATVGTFESFTEGSHISDFEYNVLSLPIDYYPTALSQIGTDVAILGIKSKDSVINQGNASMFLWDTFDSTFYREIELPFPNATALLTHNGFPFLWGGDDRGYSFSYYRGGDQIDEIFYVDDGHSPFAGAVLGENNRVLWGTNTTYPETSGSIMAYGSRNGGIEKGVHNVARVDDHVTSFTLPNKSDATILIGSGDTLSKNGGNATSVFRTNVYSVAEDFNVKEISFTLVEGVTANTNITVTTYVDNETNSKAINTIDSTNYEVGTKKITDYPDIQGDTNFFIEFKWNGEAVPIQLPIKIVITEIA